MLRTLLRLPVRNVLRKCADNFDRFEWLNIDYGDYVPDVIEIDEIHVKLQEGVWSIMLG